MTIRIGRSSGPILDQEVILNDVTPEQLEAIKDTLAAVNKVTNDKEGWYYCTGLNTDDVTIPEFRD